MIHHSPTDAPWTLVLGNVERWRDRQLKLPISAGLRFLDVDQLSERALREMQPDIILSPLVVRQMDAVEIAKSLAHYGFRGRYRVVAGGVPDPQMIEKEVKSAVPNLDFAILNLPHLAGVT